MPSVTSRSPRELEFLAEAMVQGTLSRGVSAMNFFMMCLLLCCCCRRQHAANHEKGFATTRRWCGVSAVEAARKAARGKANGQGKAQKKLCIGFRRREAQTSTGVRTRFEGPLGFLHGCLFVFELPRQFHSQHPCSDHFLDVQSPCAKSHCIADSRKSA